MNAASTYDKANIEPPLDDVLDDPIVKALMNKDGVEVTDLRPMLEQIARESAARSDSD
ncbi:MAG: hypothetical protein MRY32_09795 [Rickettsiales bacterium]|nr:hypothetical protein [Rickettsiales bacterium]